MNLVAFNNTHFVIDSMRDIGIMPGPLSYTIEDFMTPWGLVVPSVTSGTALVYMLKSTEDEALLHDCEYVKSFLGEWAPPAVVTVMDAKGFITLRSIHVHEGRIIEDVTLLPKRDSWITLMGGGGDANAAVNLLSEPGESIKTLMDRIEKLTVQRFAKPLIIDIASWKEENKHLKRLPAFHRSFPPAT